MVTTHTCPGLAEQEKDVAADPIVDELGGDRDS